MDGFSTAIRETLLAAEKRRVIIGVQLFFVCSMALSGLPAC